ncbi:hypothetical protein IMZ48_03580 [Candidatus Bathyarchaeota archaeon]|nr:hypothetical protein [Candidatus Bathyarchaeota archaeon]
MIACLSKNVRKHNPSQGALAKHVQTTIKARKRPDDAEYKAYLLHMGSGGAPGAHFDLFYEEGWLDLLQWDEWDPAHCPA